MNFNSKNKRLKSHSRLLRGTLAVLAGVLYVAIMSFPVHAGQAGRLDNGFGDGGIVYTDTGDGTYLALQPDSKIVVAGSTLLQRFNTDGTPDTTFGTGGSAAVPEGLVRALTLLADGRIVVSVDNSNSAIYLGDDFHLVGYTSNGILDVNFGSGGTVVTPIGANHSEARDLSVQSDGKIVAVGGVYEILSGPYYPSKHFSAFALARFNPDGSLDTTFGAGGTVISPDADLSTEAALQADGKIVAAGTSGSDFALARYHSDGTLDNTFGTGGILTSQLLRANDLTIQPDGKIVVLGYASGINSDFALARYQTDGSLDTTFGLNGLVTTDFDEDGDYGIAVALDADGKIVAAGNAFIIPKGSQTKSLVMGLVRYHPNGEPDSRFGTQGFVTTQVAGTSYVGDLAIQPDGKYLVSGTALVRYK